MKKRKHHVHIAEDVYVALVQFKLRTSLPSLEQAADVVLRDALTRFGGNLQANTPAEAPPRAQIPVARKR